MSGPAPTQPHESAIQALELPYPRRLPGGYCIRRDAVFGAVFSDGLFILRDGVEIVDG